MGLEGQQAAILDFLNGGRWQLKKSFTEVESGRKNTRPELAKAVAACKVYGARLIVAKLDRLSRDVGFLVGLKASGVRFLVADMPDANEMTIELFAVLAQHESRVISERTKAALAAAKRRGVKLGGHRERISASAARRGAVASARLRSERADDYARAFASTIAEIRASGASSLREIARALNERGIEAPRRGTWAAAQVARLISRIEHPRKPR